MSAQASALGCNTALASLQTGTAGIAPEHGTWLGSSVLPPSPRFASVALARKPVAGQAVILYAAKNSVECKVATGAISIVGPVTFEREFPAITRNSEVYAWK